MTINSDPIVYFQQLYAQVENVPLSNAMSLATASSDGKPTVRMVLLKHVDERGFIFYTNDLSPKAIQIKDNPYAALCFWWNTIGFQIRVEGIVTQISAQESDAYFASRPRNSQISAWASKQSQPIETTALLQEKVTLVEKKFHNQPIPRPSFWSGYLITPSMIEFWENKIHRLHHRLIYHRKQQGWSTELLQP